MKYIPRGSHIFLTHTDDASEEIPKNWEKINILNYKNILQRKNDAIYDAKWENFDVFENYRNKMRVRCAEELYASVDRKFDKVIFDLNLRKTGEEKSFDDIIVGTSKFITSEPGGGKSFLMWMLMRHYLEKEDEKLPIVLEGRYYGRIYHSISEGIYKELYLTTPCITVEMVEKNIQEGKFIVLFDALDEVQHNYDLLIDELHKLRGYTENILIITSRTQNYKGDFCKNFEHYALQPLSDTKVIELLEKYSLGKMVVNIHQIPKRLLEVIRTPLFLKMFVMVSRREKIYKIPGNHAALFEMYIMEKVHYLGCSHYDEEIIKKVLGKYAFYSYVNGDCTDVLFNVLQETCVNGGAEKYYELIWKTGLIYMGQQGIRFIHKAILEFFVALSISYRDTNEIITWLDEQMFREEYEEIICYLTGIISNQQKQDYILDHLEKTNLQLYIKALNSRKNFNAGEMVLPYEEAIKYFSQILSTYCSIIQTHFYNIAHVFEGFKLKGKGKTCIKGDINYDRKTISLVIYNSCSDECEQLHISISHNDGINMISKDGANIPVHSAIFSSGNMNTRYYNLELLSLGLDSAREIAVDIIKGQLKKFMEQRKVFDVEIDVLLVERVEAALKNVRSRNYKLDDKDKLSLYSSRIENIISMLLLLGNNDSDINKIIPLCKILEQKGIEIDEVLDIQPDIKLAKGQYSHWYHELYSDEQLVKKVTKVLYLSQKALHQITTEIIPVLAPFNPNIKMIGIVHRKERTSQEAGVDYINVRVHQDEDNSPFMEFRERSIGDDFSWDIFTSNMLKKMRKGENDYCGGMSSTLMHYFENDFFHKIIYGKVEELLGKLFGGKL